MAIEIAVYGKGGIGKSTISANLSYTFAKKGEEVVQIGCDPKHDSTRMLLKGKSLTTVLDMIRTRKVSERRLEDVMAIGSAGVKCIEAGGPEPGIGCAGKGILSMFQTLEKLDLASLNSDIVIYDVLGDVVCGGFAVPMRPEHSDLIVIVTSGEFMSLYAANNIMKGLRNFDTERPRLAGIIFNSRGSDYEKDRVGEFSKSTGVPILASIPRSELFRDAESDKTTLCEKYPNSEECALFDELAEKLKKAEKEDALRFFPHPLSDAQLDQLASGAAVTGKGDYLLEHRSAVCSSEKIPNDATSTPIKRIGMGPIGAALTAGKVTDIPVVIHGSRSCGYSMLNELYEERLAHLRNNPERPVGTGENVFCSETGVVQTVFGGTENLESLLDRLSDNHRYIMVIMTCMTSMIGDDTRTAVNKVLARHPDTKISVINTNSALEGVDAHMEVIRELSELIDTSRKPDGKTVRIIDDNFVTTGRGDNEKLLSELLRPFGLQVGPGFICDCNLQDIENLKTTEICILSEASNDNLALAGILRAKGVSVAMRPLPKGYREGREWVEHFGKMRNNPVAAGTIMDLMDREYRKAVETARPILTGKRIAFLYDPNESTLWMEEALTDAGVEDLTVYARGPSPPKPHIAEVRTHWNTLYGTGGAFDEPPDLVIGSKYSTRALGNLICEVYPTTTLAHYASIRFLERVCDILSAPEKEGWHEWRCCR